MVVLFYWLLNNVIYNWTGSLYPEGTGYHLDTILGFNENLIPFSPEWAIFYLYLFYPLSAITMVYFAFIDSEKGPGVGWSLVIINLIADVIYIFFPVSTYWYRQELLANPLTGNFWAEAMYAHYQGDPSFNCFPSLHAAVSFIAFYVWFEYSKINPKPWKKVVAYSMLVVAIGVVISTIFVKQHYIVDEIAGIILALVVGKLVIAHFWKPFLPQKQK
jgi:membrane-associated phospholipid phosphatase